MKFWKSVVGKLWFTILSLVLIVLFILTVSLLEFIENYHVEEAEKDLTRLADKIAVIIENHEDQPLARSITWELADNLTSIAIIQDDKHVWYSPNDDNHLSSITLEQIKHDRDLHKALTDRKKVSKRAVPNNAGSDNERLIVGVPYEKDGKKRHGLFYPNRRLPSKIRRNIRHAIFFLRRALPSS